VAALNRRGVFFTLLAILIIAIFVASLAFFSGFLERESSQKRVSSLSDFVFSVEEDLPRQLFTNGFRAIFLIEREIAETGNYASDVEAVFQEAFFSGEVYGEEDSLLIGTTFDEIVAILQERGEKVNANVSLESPVLSVVQSDPWNVDFVLEAQLYVSDTSGLAEWNKTIEVVAEVPIESFSDPLYFVNSNGFVVNKFEESPYDDFVSDSDVSNLFGHLENSYYVVSSDAPSFLQRLEGDLSANVYGVESLVDLSDLSDQGIGLESKSVVDHIYFSGSNPSSCNVQPSGMPSWFRLDSAHLAQYEVSCA